MLLSTHFCLPLSYDDHHANQHDDITDIAPISVTTEHIGKQAGKFKSQLNISVFFKDDELFCAIEEVTLLLFAILYSRDLLQILIL